MSEASPEVLRAYAARAAPAAEPGAFAVVKLKGDASNRSYYRLCDRAGDRSFVLMSMPKEQKSEEATSGAPPTELPFLNVHRYLERLGVRVPKIHLYDPEAGIMVLEDLGDVTFEAGLSQGEPQARREQLYGQAIELLARLRARADRAPDPSCLSSTRAFDFELYRWEFDHFLEWGLAARHDATLADDAASEVRAIGDSICRALAELPRGFTHRDYQSRNLMLLPGDELCVIDFQDALQGPHQYDLVALLRDSYVELPLTFVEQMVRRYLIALEAEGGPALDPERFLADFHLLTVQRKLKDAGRFVFIDRVKKNPSFLPYVTPSLGYVREALGKRPELARLQELLARHVPELS